MPFTEKERGQTFSAQGQHKGNATWTCQEEHGPLWYIQLAERAPPPYRTQREVRAILDIDADGRLAGVELIDDMPLPPTSK